MEIVQVVSEWDLGIPMLYMTEDLAREAVIDALPDVGLEDSLEDYEDENLITFETVTVVE